jgi:PAS domain-containing protein
MQRSPDSVRPLTLRRWCSIAPVPARRLVAGHKLKRSRIGAAGLLNRARHTRTLSQIEHEFYALQYKQGSLRLHAASTSSFVTMATFRARVPSTWDNNARGQHVVCSLYLTTEDREARTNGHLSSAFHGRARITGDRDRFLVFSNMSMQCRLIRALRYATIALLIAASSEVFAQFVSPHLSAWQSHIVSIMTCVIIVFLLTAAGFPREQNKPQQFSKPRQQLQGSSGRKRKQDAMAESEGRYRSLFENMLEGFAYCEMLFDNRGRPIDFVYLDVNSMFGKLTGLQNVVGKRFTEVIPGGDKFAARIV